MPVLSTAPLCSWQVKGLQISAPVLLPVRFPVLLWLRLLLLSRLSPSMRYQCLCSMHNRLLHRHAMCMQVAAGTVTARVQGSRPNQGCTYLRQGRNMFQ